ncbi:MAG: hypothetical protein ACRCSU_01960 [Paracoccaceae bacterium]
MTAPVAVTALATLLCMAQAAFAEGPKPEYSVECSSGSAEQAMPRDPPALMNDFVRLDPMPDGALVLSTCDELPAETGDAVIFDFDRFGEVPTLLVSRNSSPEVWCQYFNDYDIYPC